MNNATNNHNNNVIHPPPPPRRSSMIRKRSLSRVKVELDIPQLHAFLTQHVVRVGVAGAVALQQQLDRRHRRNDEWSRQELLDCASIITDFINTTTTTTTTTTSDGDSSLIPVASSTTSCSCSQLVVFQAHSFVGCIQAKLQRPTLAAGSFLRALWMTRRATTTDSSIPLEDVALTMHRLAQAYGTMGKNNHNHNTTTCYRQDAIHLLETAILKYTAAGLWGDHAVVVEARNLLAHYCHQAVSSHNNNDHHHHQQLHRVLQQTNHNTISRYYHDNRGKHHQYYHHHRNGRSGGRHILGGSKQIKIQQQRRWTSFAVSKDPSLVGKPLAPLIEEETERRCSF